MSSIVIEHHVTDRGLEKARQIKAEPGKGGTMLVAAASALFGFWALACLVGGIGSCGSLTVLRDAVITMLTGL